MPCSFTSQIAAANNKGAVHVLAVEGGQLPLRPDIASVQGGAAIEGGRRLVVEGGAREGGLALGEQGDLTRFLHLSVGRKW